MFKTFGSASATERAAFNTFSYSSKKGFRSNDNLADLISRIRNGYFRSFEDIVVIDCKETRDLLDAFIYAGYINS